MSSKQYIKTVLPLLWPGSFWQKCLQIRQLMKSHFCSGPSLKLVLKQNLKHKSEAKHLACQQSYVPKQI